MVLMSLLGLSLLLTQLKGKSKFLSTYLPDAGVTVFVGVATGLVIEIYKCYYPDEDDNTDDISPAPAPNIFSEDNENDDEDDSNTGVFSFNPIFFLVIQLPPIIFTSGFNIDIDQFVLNFRPIAMFAFLGTMTSTVIVAGLLYYVVTYSIATCVTMSLAELAAFGALISATDPVSTLAVFEKKKVDPQLFYLVFGESVINDAAALVLFDACVEVVEAGDGEYNVEGVVAKMLFVFVASFTLGILFAMFFALIFKHVDFLDEHSQMAELAVFVMIVYFLFVVAEIAGVSGIVTLLITAMTSQRIVLPNLSDRTILEAEAIFRMLAHLSEESIFLILGMSVFQIFNRVDVSASFIGWTFLACLIGRAVQVYGLSFIYNNTIIRCKSSKRIEANTQHMLFYSGLRGAIAYCCAVNFPNTNGNRDNVIAITMVVVLVSVFILGGTTDAALNTLKIKTAVDEKTYIEEMEHQEKMSMAFAGGDKERKKKLTFDRKVSNLLESICVNGAGSGRTRTVHGSSLTDYAKLESCSGVHSGRASTFSRMQSGGEDLPQVTEDDPLDERLLNEFNSSFEGESEAAKARHNDETEGGLLTRGLSGSSLETRGVASNSVGEGENESKRKRRGTSSARRRSIYDHKGANKEWS
ncbi:hypothetical protein ScalyP_jg5509 [Parmales sp. scaly parma]|nr:hypothetical protein ScalyP_jg5509 [Parmales sp. scaly parma]